MREEVLVHEGMVRFRVFAWYANVLVLQKSESADVLGASAGMPSSYHVECNDMFEGDLAGFVFLDEDLVDANRAGASRQTENKRMCSCWTESLYPVWQLLDLVVFHHVRGLTDDVVGNIG